MNSILQLVSIDTSWGNRKGRTMPAKIWWIATAFVSFTFVVSLLTESSGLTTFCGLNAIVAVSLLAIPSVTTATCAAVATYREYMARLSGDRETSRLGPLELFGRSVA